MPFILGMHLEQWREAVDEIPPWVVQARLLVYDCRFQRLNLRAACCRSIWIATSLWQAKRWSSRK